MFGDFQSLKPNPDEHRIQPIGASQLEQSVALLNDADLCRTEAEALRHAEAQAMKWADARTVRDPAFT